MFVRYLFVQLSILCRHPQRRGRSGQIKGIEYMKNWERALVSPDTNLRDALETINDVGCQLAIVVDENRKLLGVLSDGDARRALLKGLTLVDRVSEAMYRTPTIAYAADSRDSRLALMRRMHLRQLPLIDPDGMVVGMEILDDFLNVQTRDEWVVIMAGGLGSRLKELTQETPKPMLKVGPRPLLETIVRGFAEQGFNKFYFAVNYKAEQIEAHFGDGRHLGVEIRYLREEQRMGTAGALSLLSERPNLPLVVTNADLLTKVNFGNMVDQHTLSGAHATMAVRQYEMQVPFGVVNLQNGFIHSIVEKPTQHFTVSAGIYVLSPEMLALVPPNCFFDMPSLFELGMERGLKARAHQIDDYWLDIGRFPDFERANLEFSGVFY